MTHKPSAADGGGRRQQAAFKTLKKEVQMWTGGFHSSGELNTVQELRIWSYVALIILNQERFWNQKNSEESFLNQEKSRIISPALKMLLKHEPTQDTKNSVPAPTTRQTLNKHLRASSCPSVLTEGSEIHRSLKDGKGGARLLSEPFTAPGH